MGIFLKPHKTDHCCLCGSPDALTGEHKIKASALRGIFGNDRMVMGNFDGKTIPRSAQGPKSRIFHFSARICAKCNGHKTQNSDREFDRFSKLVSSLLSENKDPTTIFKSPEYKQNSEAYLNVFRYFAKIICCHIAESGGPRLISASDFAIGNNSKNTVNLHIDIDPTYIDHAEKIGEHKYAAHGGLIVPVNGKTELPTSFRSSITLNSVRYIFWVSLSPITALELRLFHREFWEKCKEAYIEALRNPLSENERRRLGI